MKTLNPTASKILELAQLYTQTRGFNAFSYRDIQNEIGVKTSTIHYYFPTKNDLAKEITQRYFFDFQERLSTISNNQQCGLKRLKQFAKIHTNMHSEGKFCLFVMLCRESDSMPKDVNATIKHFFKNSQTWISDSIELAIKQGKICSSKAADDLGRQFLAILHGGMIINPPQKSTCSSLQRLVKKAIEEISI